MSLLKYKLERWQNLFVKDVWEAITKKYEGFSIICYEYSVVMYREVDKKLPDYDWWFYFVQINGTLTLKYRPYPNKKYVPDTIYIDDTSKLNSIIAHISRVIDSRFGYDYKDNKPVYEEPTNPKQTRSTHSDIIVPERYENGLYNKSNRDKIIERKIEKKNSR